MRERRSRQPEKRTFVKTIQPSTTLTSETGFGNAIAGQWVPMPMFFDNLSNSTPAATRKKLEQQLGAPIFTESGGTEGMMVEVRNAEIAATPFRISDIDREKIKAIISEAPLVPDPTPVPRGYTKEPSPAPAEAPAVVRDPDYLRINAWMLDMTALLGLTVEEVKEAFDIYPDLVEGTVVLRSKAGHVVARGTLPLGKEVPAPELLELYAAPETPAPLPAAPILTVREVAPVALPAEDVDPDARAPLELY